jgi:hypothetical protein
MPALKTKSVGRLRYRQNIILTLGGQAMIKALFLSLLLATAAGTFAVQAQSGSSDGGAPGTPPKARELLNKKYLTPTGETVAHPGESQGGPTTDLDRRIEQENDKLDQGICANCN